MDKYHPGYFGKVRIATDTTYRSLGASRRVVDRGARARRRVGSSAHGEIFFRALALVGRAARRALRGGAPRRVDRSRVRPRERLNVY